MQLVAALVLMDYASARSCFGSGVRSTLCQSVCLLVLIAEEGLSHGELARECGGPRVDASVRAVRANGTAAEAGNDSEGFR